MTSRASGILRSASIITARANTAMPPLKSIAPRPNTWPSFTSPANGSSGPLFALDADDVGMRGEKNRPLRPVALESRDEVRLPRIRRLDDLDVEAERFEAGREHVGDPTLVARRVARVGANQVAEQRDGRIGVRALRAGGAGGREESRECRNTREAEHVWSIEGEFEREGPHERMTRGGRRCNGVVPPYFCARTTTHVNPASTI